MTTTNERLCLRTYTGTICSYNAVRRPSIRDLNRGGNSDFVVHYM